MCALKGGEFSAEKFHNRKPPALLNVDIIIDMGELLLCIMVGFAELVFEMKFSNDNFADGRMGSLVL